MSLCLIGHKTDQLNKKCEKLRNGLLKLKELNQIVFRKELFTSNKGPFDKTAPAWSDLRDIVD